MSAGQQLGTSSMRLRGSRTCWRAGAPSFRELLARVKAVVRGALDNADLPFTRVVQAAGVPRSAAHSPLFQVMCVLQDAGVDAEVVMDGLTQDFVEVAPLPRTRVALLALPPLLQAFTQ